MAGRRPHPLDALIDPGARLERVATGFGFLAGPVWHRDGYLLCADVPRDRIVRWDPAGGVAVVRAPSGHAGGLALDARGALLACEHDTSTLVRLRPDGGREVVASHWGGRELDSPADVIVGPDGTIWFTDPHPAGQSVAWGIERAPEHDRPGVYRLPEGGSLELVADDLAFPGGLCLSPDGCALYVSDALRMQVRAFQLSPRGTVVGDAVLHQLDGAVQLMGGRIVPADVDSLAFDHGYPAGIACDERGTVWCTGPGGVWVIGPEGAHVGTVVVPELVAGLAWGGPGRRSLFLTATSSLYRLPTLVAGAPLPHLAG